MANRRPCPPAGGHPLLDGIRRVTVSGFTDKPRVSQEDGAVSVEAEGLRLSFQGAVVRTHGDEVRVRLRTH